MALRAVTSLQHFRELQPAPDTERVLVPAGEEVPEDLYTDEELEELKSFGAVVEEGDLQKEEDLRKQVEELQRKLAEQDQELQLTRSQQRSPGTLLQTEAVTEENVNELGEDNDPTPSNARPAVAGDEALATAGQSKVAKDGEVKPPNQAAQAKK